MCPPQLIGSLVFTILHSVNQPGSCSPQPSRNCPPPAAGAHPRRRELKATLRGKRVWQRAGILGGLASQGRQGNKTWADMLSTRVCEKPCVSPHHRQHRLGPGELHGAHRGGDGLREDPPLPRLGLLVLPEEPAPDPRGGAARGVRAPHGSSWRSPRPAAAPAFEVFS